jgi:WD40 repeat protein
MEKQNWVSRRTSVVEELSCLLWGSALFGGNLTGHLKQPPFSNFSDADLCELFTFLRDRTYLSQNYLLKVAILNCLLASMRGATFLNHLPLNKAQISDKKEQLENWLTRRNAAVREEMRLCQIKQSDGKIYPNKNLVNASAAEIYQYSHRDRSQDLQNLKHQIESALYVNTIPQEFRHHFKQDWLPYVSLFFAKILIKNAKIRTIMLEIIEAFNQLDYREKKIPKASEALGQFIHLFAHPQICLSLVQVIDFDCQMLKQKMRQSINQDSGDALEPEEVEKPTILPSPISTNGQIDTVLSILENRQRVEQSNHAQPANVPILPATGESTPAPLRERQIETLPPQTAAQPATPLVKNLDQNRTSPLPTNTAPTNSKVKGSGLRCKCTHTLTEHSDSVVSVAYSTGNGETQTLATGSWDKTIKIWAIAPSFAKPFLIRTLTAHSASVYSVALTGNGQILASGGVDCTIQLWNLGSIEHTSTGASLMQTLTGHTFPVYSLAFSPDGKLLASGSGDYTIKIWQVDTGKLLLTLLGHSSFVYSVAFSPDGKTIASGSADKSIKIWQASNGELLRTLISYAPVNSVAFSPDRQFLVSAGGDERIKLWQLNTSHLGADTRPAPTQTLTGHTGEIFSLAFSPRSPILASSSYDKTIKLWNFQTGNLLSTLTGHLHSVHSVAFSANGMTLFSASHDKTIKLWQIIPETKKS